MPMGVVGPQSDSSPQVRLTLQVPRRIDMDELLYSRLRPSGPFELRPACPRLLTESKELRRRVFPVHQQRIGASQTENICIETVTGSAAKHLPI